MKKFGFTLAEVLITLAIIGIVAALTVPALIQSYEKKVTSTKIKKFNSIITEAILLNNNEYYGSNWIYTAMQNPDNYSETFFKTYLDNKIRTLHTESKLNGKMFYVKLYDGSGFIIWRNNIDFKLDYPFYITYCSKYEHCSKNGQEGYDGRNGFLFKIEPDGVLNTYCSTSMDRNYLLRSCKARALNDRNKSHCCSALLKKDNWEFLKDYPWDW